MPRFELVEGKSSKYWEITLKGKSFTVRFGKIGTDGQQQRKDFASAQDAKSEYEKLIAQKLKKGYVELKVGAAKSGRTGASPGKAKGGMTKNEFWYLIEQSKRGAEDTDEQAKNLQKLLERLTAEEILSFDRHFQEADNAAYDQDLWGIAYIINGGCSDDGFDYFIGWLIAQGQKYFEDALKDPEKAAKKVQPGDHVECEGMRYVAVKAYEKVTGRKQNKSDFYDKRSFVQRILKGEEWDEDELCIVYSRLARKFGM